MASLPKYYTIASITLVLMCSSTWNTLLSSIYQAILHCLPSMVLVTMHLSYRLTTNPCDFRVFASRSYDNIAESMQTYKALNSLSCSTFIPFSILTFSLCYGFTSLMISKNLPSIFNMMVFILTYRNWGISLSLSILTWNPCIATMINIGGWISLPGTEDSGALGTVPIGLRATLYPILQTSVWLSLVLLFILVPYFHTSLPCSNFLSDSSVSVPPSLPLLHSLTLPLEYLERYDPTITCIGTLLDSALSPYTSPW